VALNRDVTLVPYGTRDGRVRYRIRVRISRDALRVSRLSNVRVSVDRVSFRVNLVLVKVYG